MYSEVTWKALRHFYDNTQILFDGIEILNKKIIMLIFFNSKDSKLLNYIY